MNRQELEKMKLNEIKELVRNSQHKIKGFSKMKKDLLISILAPEKTKQVEFYYLYCKDKIFIKSRDLKRLENKKAILEKNGKSDLRIEK